MEGVPILGHQILHKCINDEHRPSGKGLLLIISASVSRYLYAGEIKDKIHLKIKDTQPSIQDKNLFAIRHRHTDWRTPKHMQPTWNSWESGIIDLRAHLAVNQPKMGRFGAWTRSAGHRLAQWTFILRCDSLSLAHNVGSRWLYSNPQPKHPWSPSINMRGGGQMETTPPGEDHLSWASMQAKV